MVWWALDPVLPWEQLGLSAWCPGIVVCRSLLAPGGFTVSIHQRSFYGGKRRGCITGLHQVGQCLGFVGLQIPSRYPAAPTLNQSSVCAGDSL